MKNITYLLAIACTLLFSCGLLAQNWTPFPYNQKTWFEFENPFHYSKSVYFADSLEENGDTTNHYFLLNYLDDLVNVEINCLEYNYYGTTWLDFLDERTTNFVSFKTPFQEVNGLWYLNGSLVFDHNLEVGENITVFPTNFDEVKITCTNKTTESIFGITDSIKVFSLQAYNSGQLVDSDYDNHEYKLSKNYGFITFLPFSKLLGNPNTTAKVVGFEDDNQMTQGTKAWTIADFIPYEAGDVIYYKDSYYDYLNNYFDYTYGIDSITSNAIIEEDSVKYTYYKLSPTGEIISEELTNRTTINSPGNNLFDKGVYRVDLNDNYCAPYSGSAMTIFFFC